MEKYLKVRNAVDYYNINYENRDVLNILEYVLERIISNEKQIKEILSVFKRSVSYEEIEKCIIELRNKPLEYKSENNLKKIDNKFVSSIYSSSIGVVGIETNNTIDAFRYMLEGIRTRNGVIIIDSEYQEYDGKHLLKLILTEALKKFGIDENLIQIIPYEEADISLYDKTIYLRIKKVCERKTKTDFKYIYMENEKFEKIIQKDIEKKEKIKVLSGNMNQCIEKINKNISNLAIIYTEDSKKAYEFINKVHASNVFVNASIKFEENIKENDNELLMNKKIIYEYLKNENL